MWGLLLQFTNNEKIIDKITEKNFKNSCYTELVNFEFLESCVIIDLYMGTKLDYFMEYLKK